MLEKVVSSPTDFINGIVHLDIYRLRRESGASLQQVADYADVPVGDLTEWDRRGEVPGKYAAQVRWGLWAAQRDAALAKSNLPECEWPSVEASASAPPDPQDVAKHMAKCPTCTSRSRFVKENVGPMPPMGRGLTMYAMALLDRFTGWQQSAVGGAILLLGMGGIGVVILLLLAVVNLDLDFLLGASAGFALLVLSGSAGGIVHYHTRALRATGALGHYLSSVLTVFGYLGAVFGMIAIAAMVVGWETVGSDTEDMLTTRAGWILMAVCGVFFGLVFGRATRE